MIFNQPQEIITLKINSQEDLERISNIKLDLLLPRGRQKRRKLDRVNQTEPLLVCELPVKVHQVIPIKEATVKVHSITAHLVE